VQFAELQPVVAAHAGIRCAAGVVLIHEVINDAAEVLLEIAHIERNAELGGDQARIGGIVDRAAALVANAKLFRVAAIRVFSVILDQLIEGFARRAQAHEAAHHVIALAQQQRGGDRAVHAA
jgi:hypothetical protein